jgi:hypothetical protein
MKPEFIEDMQSDKISPLHSAHSDFDWEAVERSPELPDEHEPEHKKVAPFLHAAIAAILPEKVAPESKPDLRDIIPEAVADLGKKRPRKHKSWDGLRLNAEVIGRRFVQTWRLHAMNSNSPELHVAFDRIEKWVMKTSEGVRNQYNRSIEYKAGMRFLAFAWTLNPNFFDGGPGIRELATRLDISAPSLSIPAAEASRFFGITNAAQITWQREHYRNPDTDVDGIDDAP